jgi:hypothetical protein
MKKIALTLFSLVFAIILFAQQAPPQGINYQAMVYVPYGNQQVGVNNAGQIPANTKQVLVKFTLEEGNNGPVIYEETLIDTTDQYGLLNAVIGTGTPTSNSPGLFNQIDWSQGDPYLRVSITLTQYNSTVSSYQKLWSVPYALYADQTNSANTADYATNSGHADSSDYADVAGNGITGVIDNGNGTLTFTYLDGSTYTTPVLTGLMGTPGPQGPAGQNGQSAYDIWLSQGNTGTQQDFLNSLQGATGPQGVQGSAGATGSQGPQGIQGPAGPQGPQGIQGTPGSQNAWSLTGNAGTSPTSNFIGTTDSQDWVVKTNNTERMRVTSAGNVGIGTSSPTEKLEILNGNINLTSPTFDANSLYGPGRVELYRGLNAFSPHTNGYIDFKDTVTDDYDFRIYYSNPSALAPSGGLVFRSGPDASFNNRMTILNNGNVGIGTSSPLYKLSTVDDGLGVTMPFGITDIANNPRFRIDVEGDNSTAFSNIKFDVYPLDNISKAEFRFFRSTNTTGPKTLTFFKGDGTATEDAQIGVDGLNSYFQRNGGNFGIGTNSPLGRFHVDNDVSGSDSSFVVTTDGNVGIGTSSPISKFEVNKGHISTIVPYSTSPIINTYDDLGNIKFRTQLNFTSTYSEIDFDAIGPSNTTEARFRFFRHVNTTGPKEIRFLRGNGTTEISGQIAVDGGNSFFQRHGGNFGIGTAAPARTLHVNAVMRLEPISTAPTSPAKGDMYFDSTINKLRVYDGTTWQSCW